MIINANYSDPYILRVSTGLGAHIRAVRVRHVSKGLLRQMDEIGSETDTAWVGVLHHPESYPCSGHGGGGTIGGGGCCGADRFINWQRMYIVGAL